MYEINALDSAVAQRDRISVEVGDLKEEIETCRTDAAWSELPLSAKIRVLVKERLQQIKKENGEPTKNPSPDEGKG